MKMSITTSLAATMLAMAGQAFAHVELLYPPGLRSKFNSFVPRAESDSDLTSPLSSSGANFPCHGYLADLGTTKGSPVATWAPGSTYNFTFPPNGAPHGGGSCQASLSIDGGKSFKVLHTYIGGCPESDGSYSFALPSDTPAVEKGVFAWTWFNHDGNREMYMNCAVVTISGGAKARRASSVSFASRPEIFMANIKGTPCTTPSGKDVLIPDPGPDVTTNSAKGPFEKPGGEGCVVAIPDSGSGTLPATSEAPPAAPSSSVAPSPPAAPPVTQKSSATAPTAGAPAKASSTSLYASLSSALHGGVTVVPIASSNSSSSPGGVFATTPQVGSPPKPTTLVTVTSAKPEPGNTASDETPATTASPSPDSGDAGEVLPGTACTTEGRWNCVEGSKFQRCASGQWSKVIEMAAGTKCQPGQSDNLVLGAKRALPVGSRQRSGGK